MHDKLPSSDPLSNYLIRHETLPSQHEGALRAYYWSIDRVVGLQDGEDSIKGIVTRLIEDHYEVTVTQAEQLVAESLADLPLASAFQDDDVRRVSRETLLLFPLLELGSFVDGSYEPGVSAQWYAKVGAAILERTNDDHSDDCLSYGEKGCNGAVRCPWRVVAGVLTGEALDPHLTSIEYLLEPERQGEMVIAKLIAARMCGLKRVGERNIEDAAGFYRALTNQLQQASTDEPL